MELSYEERKELADLDYEIETSFYNYENNKRLNLTQKATIKHTIVVLKKILKENADKLFAQGKMGDYLEKTYGIKQCGTTE